MGTACMGGTISKSVSVWAKFEGLAKDGKTRLDQVFEKAEGL